MIVNVSDYRCPHCKKWYQFDTSKEHKTVCDVCNATLQLIANYDIDTEKTEKVPEMSDEQFRQFLRLQNNEPTITCPYCQSTNVDRIGLLNRIVSVELWGLASSKIGKQWRCNDCGSEF